MRHVSIKAKLMEVERQFMFIQYITIYRPI